MSLVILKFGGSVLDSEDNLRNAVHEIYRWRREGCQVVAVVSALAGRTAQLQLHVDRHGVVADSAARAATLTSGERESAALLGLKLERAGVPCAILTPAAVNLVASGPAHDANPVSLDPARFQDALGRTGVVVFPGYTAINHHGEPVALGRGGSDLTAVFLASELAADRCRLIKDVDGLYESDPRTPGMSPRRYVHATWANALATDGSIIQHKAVQLAIARRQRIELGALNSIAPTLIGAESTELVEAPRESRRLRIGMLGHGTVGGGVAELIVQHPDLFEFVALAVRNPIAHPDSGADRVTQDLTEVASCDLDVLVEAMGGVERPLAAIQIAANHGAQVVSANKSLLATYGQRPEFRDARSSGAAGGAVPVLEAVSRGRITSLHGILCGTANFVLERMRAGMPLEAAVDEARQLGLAESDATRDLDGRDAADKLCLIAHRIGFRIDPDSVVREEITATTDPQLRQVARLLVGDSECEVAVRLKHLDEDSRLLRARREQNAVLIERGDGSTEFLLGTGAGRWPTAEAVFGDLLEIARTRSEVAHAV